MNSAIKASADFGGDFAKLIAPFIDEQLQTEGLIKEAFWSAFLMYMAGMCHSSIGPDVIKILDAAKKEGVRHMQEPKRSQ